MKCSHISILAFAFLLPGCDASDSSEHDESTDGGWKPLGESIEIVPSPQGEKDTGDQEGAETGGGDEGPMASKVESESGSLTQDESSSSEEGGSSESLDPEEAGEETGEATSEDDESEESTSDTGGETGEETGDDEDDFICDWEEYEAAEACRAAVRHRQDCSLIAKAELGGDYWALECKNQLDCNPDQMARMMWEQAECMAPCRDSNPDDYLKYLCGVEQHVTLRECMIEQPCGVDNPPENARRECSVKGQFYHTQCMKTGDLTVDLDWIVNPPTYECGVDEYTAAKSCESYYANEDNMIIANCERNERNYAIGEWRKLTGSQDDPPEEWLGCEVSRRCEWQARPANSLVCVSQCKNSHPEDALHQECMVERDTALEECIRGTRVGNTSEFENGIECTDNVSTNDSRLSTCRSKADFTYGQCKNNG